MFPKDIKIISNRLNISQDAFKKKYCYSTELQTEIKKINLVFLKNINNRCIFLEESNLCKIYKFRPIQCKRAPFYFFWDNKYSRIYFKCLRDIKVSEEWSSSKYDDKLINTLFKG